MNEKLPYAGSYKDRHGKRRWRFRRGKRTITLPGEPGSPEFESAYESAIAGQPAPIRRISQPHRRTGPTPRSFADAWRILRTEDPDWKALGPAIRTAQTRIAERFLLTPIPDQAPVDGKRLAFGETAIAELRRRHIKAILASRSETPHAAAHLLRVIRKLIGVALDQEWIELDPTYRLKYRPEYGGWKAWPDEIRAQFESHWPIGSTPRLAYSLALLFGHRRSDVAQVRWADIGDVGATMTQQKTGRAMWLPILPQLAAVLEAAPKGGEFVLTTKWGKPFTPAGLTVRMRDWTSAAGIPAGYTLHGLRKTLGKALAEGGATTRQIMDVLGHTSVQHVELYTREASQRMLAGEGMSKVAGLGKSK